MKAVLLLSGGLDSAVVGAMLRDLGYLTYAVTFFYGQNHEVELEYSKGIASFLGVASHEIIDIGGYGSLTSSALTSNPERIRVGSLSEGVAPTYVPARNLVFLSIACGYAESIGAELVGIGVNSIDYSGYPDCRPEFVSAMQVAVTAGLANNVRIYSPLISLTKKEIATLSEEYKIPETNSCYNPDKRSGLPCGVCESCIIRRLAFEDL